MKFNKIWIFYESNFSIVAGDSVPDTGRLFSSRQQPDNNFWMGPKKDQNFDKARIKTTKCQYNDRGYCKHGDKFYNMHIDKVCDDKNCSGQCDKRHPIPCKFGSLL